MAGTRAGANRQEQACPAEAPPAAAPSGSLQPRLGVAARDGSRGHLELVASHSGELARAQLYRLRGGEVCLCFGGVHRSAARLVGKPQSFVSGSPGISRFPAKGQAYIRSGNTPIQGLPCWEGWSLLGVSRTPTCLLRSQQADALAFSLSLPPIRQ